MVNDNITLSDATLIAESEFKTKLLKAGDPSHKSRRDRIAKAFEIANKYYHLE